MRLTLRTMLAYLDGILEPDDAQQLGQRIEQSEQATSILHRMQDVMRRLRLGAPSLTSNSPGLDPNTVAEYLDNTLQDDRVADFEKVCLESEIHLAEVASCHQILTLVLGEPAEIDPASRERMYRLLDLKHAVAVEPPPPPPAKQESAGVTVTDEGEPHAGSSHKASRRKPTVPDYLRDPPRKRSRLSTVVVALAIVVCVAALGLYGAGQFEPGTPLGDLLGMKSTEVADNDTPTSPSTPSDEQDSPEQEPPVVEPDTPGPSGPAGEVNQLPPVPHGHPQAEPDSELPVAPLPDPLTQPLPIPDSETPAAPLPDGTHFPVPPTLPEPNQPGPNEPEPNPNEPGVETPDVPVTDVGEPDAATPDTPATNVQPAAPEAVAELAAEGQVLLRHEPQAAVWQRVGFQEKLHSQTRLTALPTYRPTIAMNSGATVQLVDGTEVELLPGDGQSPVGMKIVYGRAILTPGPEAPSHFRLQVGERSGLIVFADGQSAVAVEVTTTRTPGTDPEALPSPVVARIYPTTGQASWEESPQEETDVEALARPQSLPIAVGQCLVVDVAPLRAPVPAATLPDWVASNGTDALDARASKMIEPMLRADRSISLSLTELLDHRLEEVRWLAARCLGHIGTFDPMVAALDDPNYKAGWLAWPDHIEQLRDALTRGPQAAKQVRLAMEKQFGKEDGDAAYRMLWGYTTQGLREGQAQTLVDYLDHNTLAMRVLSFHNLESLTGLRLYYEPEQTEAKRRQSVRSWNERLKAKDFWIKLAERERERAGG